MDILTAIVSVPDGNGYLQSNLQLIGTKNLSKSPKWFHAFYLLIVLSFHAFVLNNNLLLNLPRLVCNLYHFIYGLKWFWLVPILKVGWFAVALLLNPFCLNALVTFIKVTNKTKPMFNLSQELAKAYILCWFI